MNIKTLFLSLIVTISIFINSCSTSTKCIQETCIEEYHPVITTIENQLPNTKIELIYFKTIGLSDPITQPTIVGGTDSLLSFMTYPEIAKRANVKGEVICEFIVTIEGKAKEVKIIQGIGAGCNEVVSNAIKSLNYIPANSNGININQLMRASINFILIKSQP